MPDIPFITPAQQAARRAASFLEQAAQTANNVISVPNEAASGFLKRAAQYHTPEDFTNPASIYQGLTGLHDEPGFQYTPQSFAERAGSAVADIAGLGKPSYHPIDTPLNAVLLGSPEGVPIEGILRGAAPLVEAAGRRLSQVVPPLLKSERGGIRFAEDVPAGAIPRALSVDEEMTASVAPRAEFYTFRNPETGDEIAVTSYNGFATESQRTVYMQQERERLAERLGTSPDAIEIHVGYGDVAPDTALLRRLKSEQIGAVGEPSDIRALANAQTRVQAAQDNLATLEQRLTRPRSSSIYRAAQQELADAQAALKALPQQNMDALDLTSLERSYQDAAHAYADLKANPNAAPDEIRAAGRASRQLSLQLKKAQAANRALSEGLTDTESLTRTPADAAAYANTVRSYGNDVLNAADTVPSFATGKDFANSTVGAKFPSKADAFSYWNMIKNESVRAGAPASIPELTPGVRAIMPPEQAAALDAVSQQAAASLIKLTDFLKSTSLTKGESIKGLTTAEWESLTQRIRSEPLFADKPWLADQLAVSFSHMRQGVVPSVSEAIQLQGVFGKEFGQALIKAIPNFDKNIERALELISIPRTLLATGDLSATLRQLGWFVGNPRYAKMFAQDFAFQVHAFANPEYANQIYREMYAQTDRWAQLINRPAGKEALAFLTREMPLTEREEFFKGNMIEQVPLIGNVVKRSDVAFSLATNKLRWDVANYWLDQFERQGRSASEQELDSLVKYINRASGRGNLGGLGKGLSQTILNTVFFAPRFTVSRLQLPFQAMGASGRVRGIVLQDAAGFIGLRAALLGLLVLFKEKTDVAVELDPRSSDFGKLRIGHMRFDPWIGLRSLTTLLAQELTAQRKPLPDSYKQGLQTSSWHEPIGNWVREHLAPVPAALMDWTLGHRTDVTGTPVTMRPVNPLTSNLKSTPQEFIAPLGIKDMLDGIQYYGLVGGVAAGAAGGLGIGVQTFDPLQSTIQRRIQKYQGVAPAPSAPNLHRQPPTRPLTPAYKVGA